MSCQSEKNRADDKYTTYLDRVADRRTAAAAVVVADAAVLASCPFFWTGLGGVACAAAVTALATASTVLANAVMKENNAWSAYGTAFQDYQNCLAKCKKK